MVMAPVVRGRKGEFEKLLEQFRLEGYSRVRVDGELRRLDEEIKLDKKYNHDISVVVDRLVMKTDLRRRLSESIEAAGGARRRRGRGGRGQAARAARTRTARARRGRRQGREGRRQAAARRRRAAHLQRALRLPQLRHLDPRARAADLLLQLPARRLRALPRARLPAGGRPRAGRPRPDPLARRGRAAAVADRPLALLEAAGRVGRRLRADRRRHALAGALRRRARDLPLRHRLRAPQGQLHEPLRPPPLLPRPLRGDRQQPRAPLRGDRLRRASASGSRATWPSSPARTARAPGCGPRASRSRSAGSRISEYTAVLGPRARWSGSRSWR